MKKRDQKKELPADGLEETVQPAKAERQPSGALPPLPLSDATAAGLIAAVFALIGAVFAVQAASRDKEPKPKRAKRANAKIM